ncbi:AAA family ATPase [Agrococcus sp. ProA11]|uniref:AAA family ATPase n=1 Tax=Agrococcus chionoecetis TaxID=3153752 RepID=UPI0032604B8E
MSTTLAHVPIERQKWAVRDQVPLGVITILAGTAGIAKSTILAWYVSGLTRGTLEGDYHGQPVNVAMIAGEDDLSKMLAPRLTVADANLSRVIAITGIRVQGEENRDWITSPTLAEDLAAIRDEIVSTGARVLIIDPIISLMHGDSHRLEDVRRNLDPLASMAAELEVAVICVMHFNKSAGQAGDKVSGSHGFRDIARSLMVLAVDDQTDNRILTIEKSNYSAVKPSLAFRVDSVDVPVGGGEFTTIGKAVCLGDSTLTVQDILNRDPRNLGDRSTAVLEFVDNAPGAVTAQDVEADEALSVPKGQGRVYLNRLADSGRISRATRGAFQSIRNAEVTHTPPVTSVTSVTNAAENDTHVTQVAMGVGVTRAVTDDPGYCTACGMTGKHTRSCKEMAA